VRCLVEQVAQMNKSADSIFLYFFSSSAVSWSVEVEEPSGLRRTVVTSLTVCRFLMSPSLRHQGH